MYYLEPSFSISCFTGREYIPQNPKGGSYALISPCFEKRLKAVVDGGINMIELGNCSLGTPGAIIEQMKNVPKVMEVIDKCGAKVKSVHMPFYNGTHMNFSSLDEDERKLAVYLALKVCKAYDGFGVDYFIIHPGANAGKEYRKQQLDNLCKSMTELKDSGYKIYVENMINENILYSSDEALYLTSNSPAEMVIDVNHTYFEAPENYIKRLGSKVKALHISDRDEVRERHYLPGKGILNFENIIKTLEEIGYNGVFNYETEGHKNYSEIIKKHNELFKVQK